MTLRREGLAAHLTVMQAGVEAGVHAGIDAGVREETDVGADSGVDAGGREEGGRRVGEGASTDAADGSTNLGDKTNTGGVGDNAAAGVGGGGGAAGGEGGGGLFGVKPTGKLRVFTCTLFTYMPPIVRAVRQTWLVYVYGAALYRCRMRFVCVHILGEPP